MIEILLSRSDVYRHQSVFQRKNRLSSIIIARWRLDCGSLASMSGDPNAEMDAAPCGCCRRPIMVPRGHAAALLFFAPLSSFCTALLKKYFINPPRDVLLHKTITSGAYKHTPAKALLLIMPFAVHVINLHILFSYL
ncbi:hypothetical protein [Agrobacterium sp. FDAARGOS_525]|uniref:hypothetical protein n=1 Tax=Agrobacterium sp. FDAARGOS_525 TaxID=2420311 RepID=UPI000F66056D|nr:hypothetical protein [Agrobacterium sp. FDAARGOS_525]